MHKMRSAMLLILLLNLPAGQARSQQPADDVDHAAVLRSLSGATLEKGRQIYLKSCVACHGSSGNASYPQARSFSRDRLRFGNRPYDMWRTVTFGSGLMAPQTWLSPAERYYVIQYIREAFMKGSPAGQYFTVTANYLASLPRSRRSAAQQAALVRAQALQGSQKYGQEWFHTHPGDYGPAVYSQLKDHTTAALTIRLDHRILMSYDLLTMATTACWKGTLDLSETKYTRYRGEGQPFIAGKALPGLSQFQWSFDGRFDSLRRATGIRTPLPEPFLHFRGHYVYGKQVVLSYSVCDREVLEWPEAKKTREGLLVVSQTIRVGPGSRPERILLGLAGKAAYRYRDGILTLTDDRTNTFTAAAVVSANSQIRCQVDSTGQVELFIPAGGQGCTFRLLRTSGLRGQAQQWFASYVSACSRNLDGAVLDGMIRGGPADRAPVVRISGNLNDNKAHFDPIYREDADRIIPSKAVPLDEDYPYTVDRIALPFDNPFNAWIRPTCLGFKSDGSLLMGTYTGDVWMASGIDSTLKNISWKRIASGLFECMGLKVVKDDIYVTTRNGIVRLSDLNGDGQTDFYENFHQDQDISSFFHAFNFGLETDSRGNFYYAKPGEYTDNKDPGNLIKVSPDGRHWESVATGFRVNNGITISPDDRIFVSDNQGNWEPANKICLIEKGAYYGYVPNLLSENEWSPDGRKYSKDQVKDHVITAALAPVPDTFQQPVFWMPQEFDNSPGGGVWSDKSWGPLSNQFIHTSYGTGWVYYFLTHQVEGITQGAMVALPFQLEAGIQRAAVNPVDKQVYVAGLTGWDDPEAISYGVLSRIRYKGGEGHLIRDAEVVQGGIRLTFNFKLDEVYSRALSHYDVREWNYHWTSKYGSDHYSVREPAKTGEDSVALSEALTEEGGYSLLLKMPGLNPAQTVRLRFEVKGLDGVAMKNSVYLTIHKIPR